MTDGPAWALDAAELVAAYRAGRLDPVAALEACLARIDAANPALNAIVTLDREGARAAAEASAARWRAGTALGALDGVPVTVKDNLHVGGLRATWGSRLFEGLVAPRDDILAARLRAAGCPPERITVHHTGIQLRDHPFRPRAHPGARPLRLVTVGRLVEKKGVAFGLEVVTALAREGRPVEYHVIGDGPLRGALEAQARACPPGAVRFHGAQLPADVRALLRGMDVVLAPHLTASDGDEEGVPNTLKEAMALGLPVVTTRHSGIPELVRDGESGWLAGEGDVAGLARGVLALLDHAERWAPMTAAARAAVERGFDIDRLNDRLVALYESLAPGRTREGS